MNIRILTACLLFTVIATQAQAHTPACIEAEVKSVSCSITYTAEGEAENRDFNVASATYAQNPGARTCSLRGQSIFGARLSGDAQEEFALFADGLKGQIVEDPVAGTFLIPKMYYGDEIPSNFQVVEDFPPIKVSYRLNSKQKISFITRHERVDATMKCVASLDPWN